MAVQIKIDQGGGPPPGVAGQAREDLATGTPVTLAAVGGPFSQYQWTIIDKPPNATLTSASTSTLTAPTAATTQITPDNDGTYLVELAVDAGFGLGARPEDVARITFYAGATLNPIIDQLPRRVPSFREQLEHNVPDAIDPTGNTIGWAREWQRWFKVIALAMTSGLTPPVNPGQNAQVAFGYSGNLRYATGVKVLNPTAAEDGISLTRVQAASTDVTVAAGAGAADAVIIEANAVEVARFDKQGASTSPRLLFNAGEATVAIKTGGISVLNFDLGGAHPRVKYFQTAGSGIRIYSPTDALVYSSWDVDRLRFRANVAVEIGYEGTHATGAGQALTIFGQDAKSGAGGIGGPVVVETGSADGAYLDGEFQVKVAGGSTSFSVGRDIGGATIYTAIGYGTHPPKGSLRLDDQFSIYSYGGTPGTGTRVIGNIGNDLHIGFDEADSWPVTQYVWAHGSFGLRATNGTASGWPEHATLHQNLLMFTTDGAVDINRSSHTSGAGAVTNIVGQAAFPTSGLNGGEVKVEGGAGDAGVASHGPVTLSSGGIMVGQVFADSFRLADAMELRFRDTGNYVGFKVPSLASDTTYTLPATDGSPNQQLTTDGAGNLTWQSGTAGGVTSWNTRTGAVVPVSGDYGSDLVTNDSGVIPGSTVTNAMENAYHKGVASEIQGTTLKGTPVGADVLLIEDSAASWAKKRIAITNLPGGPPTGAASNGLNGTYPGPGVNGMSGGVLTNDTAHGSRGGGTGVHPEVTNSLAGFAPAVGAANTILQSTGTGAAWNANLNMGGSIDLNDNPVFAVRDLTFQEEYSESGNAIPFDVEQFVVKTLTSSPTLTFDTPTGPCHRQLRVVQGGSGGYTITWPSVEWVGGGSPPTLSTGVGGVDIVNFFWNGSTWFGQAGLDFS